MKKILLAGLLAALSVTAASAQTNDGIAAPEAPGRILVQNKYHPKPGLEAEVLATRLEASAVRKQLGLVTGVVLFRKSEDDGSALIIWESEYPSLEARQADQRGAEGAPEFQAVQRKMRDLIEKFERDTWQIAL